MFGVRSSTWTLEGLGRRPSHISSEGGVVRLGVVVKSPPPLENRDGGWALEMGTLRLTFRAREGGRKVRGKAMNTKTNLTWVVFALDVHSPIRYQVSINVYNKNKPFWGIGTTAHPPLNFV